METFTIIKGKIMALLATNQRLTNCNFDGKTDFVFSVVRHDLSTTGLIRGRVVDEIDGLKRVRVQVGNLNGIVDFSTGVGRWYVAEATE